MRLQRVYLREKTDDRGKRVRGRENKRESESDREERESEIRGNRNTVANCPSPTGSSVDNVG